MKQRIERALHRLGRPERGVDIANRPMGCMAMGFLCLLLSLPFWSVPATLPGVDPQTAHQVEFQLREVREFINGRRSKYRELRLDGAEGERYFVKERVCGAERYAAIAARALEGETIRLRTDGGSGVLELQISGEALLPYAVGHAAAQREAKAYAWLALAMDAMGALFLLRCAALTRRRRVFRSAKGH